MKYKISVEKSALNYLEKQPAHVRKRLVSKIYELPRGDVKLLKGDFKGKYRLRVGSFRVIYRLHRKVNANSEEFIEVIVEEIDTRGDVYKDEDMP